MTFQYQKIDAMGNRVETSILRTTYLEVDSVQNKVTIKFIDAGGATKTQIEQYNKITHFGLQSSSAANS